MSCKFSPQFVKDCKWLAFSGRYVPTFAIKIEPYESFKIIKKVQPNYFCPGIVTAIFKNSCCTRLRKSKIKSGTFFRFLTKYPQCLSPIATKSSLSLDSLQVCFWRFWLCFSPYFCSNWTAFWKINSRSCMLTVPQTKLKLALHCPNHPRAETVQLLEAEGSVSISTAVLWFMFLVLTIL